MTSTKIKAGLLIAFIVPFLMACPKPKKAVPPVADTELQSSVDASLANFIITDIDMICSFGCENNLSPEFYRTAPGEDPSKMQVNRPPLTDLLAVSYNSARCKDGRVRDGSIYMFNTNTNPNARYYRNYEFKGRLDLQSYKVDGWQVKITDGTQCYVYNQLPAPNFNPAQTKLSWIIDGSFDFINIADASKNMTWKGQLTKTLINTNDPAVYNPSGQVAIDWTKAIVEYKGKASGVTSGNVPYKMTINEARPLTREFNCYPDIVGGVATIQPLSTWKEEFHPFKKGIVSFSTGDKYPREIYYGNEGNSDLVLQCDNSGEVLIKGNSYRVDFIK